jgi:hypothetical protein
MGTYLICFHARTGSREPVHAVQQWNRPVNFFMASCAGEQGALTRTLIAR